MPSNIAEGDERGTNKDSARFLYMAKGSLAELITQITIAHEIGHIDQPLFADIQNRRTDIARMLGSLIKA